MSEEPLLQYATALPLAGRTMCEVGLILKHGLLVSSSRLGEVSRLMKLNHVGKVLEGLDPDVLPLPVDDAPAQEARILQALRGGATPSHIARDFGRSLRVAGRADIAEKSASAVSFGDRDMDANHGGDDVSWTPPVSDADIKTYETCLAPDAAGSGETPAGSMTVGTNVYAVSSGTGSTGESHFVAHTKSTLAVQTTPAALALTDVSKSASAASFGDLDLDVNHVGGVVSWTPPVNDGNIKTHGLKRHRLHGQVSHRRVHEVHAG